LRVSAALDRQARWALGSRALHCRQAPPQDQKKQDPMTLALPPLLVPELTLPSLVSKLRLTPSLPEDWSSLHQSLFHQQPGSPPEPDSSQAVWTGSKRV
jgi:hypothetical protein